MHPGDPHPRDGGSRDVDGTLTDDLCSSCAEPRAQPVVSPFTQGIVTSYAVEYDAEVYRYQRAPLLPSRLSVVFAFDSYATCEAVASRHGWGLDEVMRFRLLPSPLNRGARVQHGDCHPSQRAVLGTDVEDPSLHRHLWG